MNTELISKEEDSNLAINNLKDKREIKEEKSNFTETVKEFISPDHVSINPYELESASADLTSLPSYHYRFKKYYLASHVIRPGDVEELTKLIKISRKLSIPVTIRSAGTSCFSSSTPAKGGIIIDMRRMNKIHEINHEKLTARVDSGISWLNLIEGLSDHGLAPKCYPTSFKTSCVGGFISTPGKAGIGAPKYGTMKDTVISLQLVRPDGSIVEISRDSSEDIEFDDVFGTYGIYGAVTEVELSLTKLQPSLEVTGYGFSSYKEAINFYLEIKNDIPNKPFFLSISNRDFEKYSHVDFPKKQWLVWAVFYDEQEKNTESLSFVKEKAEEKKGAEMDTSYLKEKWRDISDAEVAIGRSARNLIFQEYWISDKRLDLFIEFYLKEKKNYKFPTAFYLISGHEGHSRIKVFGLTDISKPREFFTVKAFLHDISVNSFNQGDRLYTIGIVNTFYLHKFKPGEVGKRRILKNKLDPDDLFNSYRIVNSRMTFRRIFLLFAIAKFLYKIL
ncbi:MAG: FAD-binding oxidoreductase [Promethearchaeota archaeon]